MADGADELHGTCDLCGEASDGTLQECNFLSCTFAQCKGILYHQVRCSGPACMRRLGHARCAEWAALILPGRSQSCLDKFLRSNKLDKSRKTGFKCPRGCGKGTAHSSICPGRVSSARGARSSQQRRSSSWAALWGGSLDMPRYTYECPLHACARMRRSTSLTRSSPGTKLKRSRYAARCHASNSGREQPFPRPHGCRAAPQAPVPVPEPVALPKKDKGAAKAAAKAAEAEPKPTVAAK
jgi:hypothetical protein